MIIQVRHDIMMKWFKKTHLDSMGAEANEELSPCREVNRLLSPRLGRMATPRSAVKTMATT